MSSKKKSDPGQATAVIKLGYDQLQAQALKQAALLVSDASLQWTEDHQHVVLNAQLVIDLAQALGMINQSVKEQAERERADGPDLSSMAADGTSVPLPENVVLTLKQYHGYGYNLWDYDRVLKACQEYQDKDVLAFLVRYRAIYKHIVSKII